MVVLVQSSTCSFFAATAVVVIAVMALLDSNTVMAQNVADTALSLFEATCKTTGPYGLGAPTVPSPVELVGEVTCSNGATPSSYWSSKQFELISRRNRGNNDINGISLGMQNYQIANLPNFDTFDVALHVECILLDYETNIETIVATNECWTQVTLEKEPAPIEPKCSTSSPSQDIIAPQSFPVILNVQGQASCSDGSLPASSSMTWTILPAFTSSRRKLSNQWTLGPTTRLDNNNQNGGSSTNTAVATIEDYGEYEACFQVLCVDMVNGGLEYQDQCCSKIGVLRTPRLLPFCPAAVIPITSSSSSSVGDGGGGRRTTAIFATDGTATIEDIFNSAAAVTTSTTGLISQHTCNFQGLDQAKALDNKRQNSKLNRYCSFISSMESYNTIAGSVRNPINVMTLSSSSSSTGVVPSKLLNKKVLIIQDENYSGRKPKQSAYGGCFKFIFNKEKPMAVLDFGIYGLPSGEVATITLVHMSGWETTLSSPAAVTDVDHWIASSTLNHELSELTATNLQEMHICIPSIGAVTFMDVNICDEDYTVLQATQEQQQAAAGI